MPDLTFEEFQAIEARKEAQEVRMRKIESGEMQMVDPRDAREEELRKQTAAKLTPAPS